MRSKYKIGQSCEERLSVARLPALLLVLLGLLVLQPSRGHLPVAALAFFYLLLVAKQIIAPSRLPEWFFPAADVLLLFVLALTPQAVMAFWFYFLYSMLGAGVRRGLHGAWGLAALWGLFLGFWQWASATKSIASVAHAAALAAATATAGALLAWMGEIEFRNAEEEGFLEESARFLEYEKGLRESLRRWLGAVAREFQSTSAAMVITDEETERLFFWKATTGEAAHMEADSCPLARANEFLMDDGTTSSCWNHYTDKVTGFGWRNDDLERLLKIPPPEKLAQELEAHSIMTVPVNFANRTFGRAFVIEGHKRFSLRDLRWLERMMKQMASPLENLFLLRHLRAQAVEAERRRVAGDLHDGLLQSLLSLNIQLDVLRRRAEETDPALRAELASLEDVVQREEQNLRHMVTDMRPLRVESADLPDMMHGFAERFQQETSISLDLFIEEEDLRIPNRICREIFQIYKESLQNIKKHAKASHVVVKLGHDDARALLVIDDNGEGFSFTGRYSSDELDELRLGPISIKERTRHVGGTLTLESNPGHGARLTIEIPLT